MPRFVFDDADKSTTQSGSTIAMMARGPGLQTLKRGRPMEPRVSAPPCMLKCCAEIKDFGGSSLAEICLCVSRGGEMPTMSPDQKFDGSLPEDEFDDFDLGPPPPCGPVLVRQHAMDLTAATEAKFAHMTKKLEMKNPAVMPMVTSSRAPAMAVPPPMFLRHSWSMPKN